MANPLLDDGRYPDWAAGNPVGTERVENVRSADGLPFDPVVMGKTITRGRLGDLMDQGMTVSGAVGSLGGPMARSADVAKLGRAIDMDRRGAMRREILGETGWWKNPAGEWKFEIPDNNMLIKSSLLGDGMPQTGMLATDDLRKVMMHPTREQTLKDILIHDELFKNYPQLKNLTVGAQTGPTANGAWNPFAPAIDLAPRMRPIEDTINTLLHEITHATQSIEGWQNGSNPQVFLPKTYEELAKNSETAAKTFIQKGIDTGLGRGEIEDMLYLSKAIAEGKLRPDSPLFMKFSQFMADKPELREELLAAGRHESKRAQTYSDAYDQYNRVRGEVEARAVGRRADMTPDQRQAFPFWESMDVQPKFINRGEIMPWFGEKP